MEEAKTSVCYLCVIFQSNKIILTLETHFDKSISISGSNNAGSGGEVPSHRMPTGVRSRSPWALRHFTTLFLNNTFLGIFWHKFQLKYSIFKCLNKVCRRASKACTPGRMPSLAPSLPPCCATERDHFEILKHTATNAWYRLIAV